MTKNLTFNILLVEDYLGYITVLTLFLENLGYHYKVAESGREALDLFARHPFNLVLLDLHLPDLDGYTVATEMQAMNPAVPIVGLTSYLHPEWQKRCHEAGILDLYEKNFDQQKLRDLIECYAR